MLFLDRVTRFRNRVYRSKNGIWTPDGVVPVKQNVLAILRRDGIEDPELFIGANTVTNAGDIYYAQRGTSTTVTNDFSNSTAGLRLGQNSGAVAKTDTDVTTFITGANTALDATYPKVSDGDTDNTGSGADIASWRYQYSAGSFSATVKEGAIVDNDGTPTVALTHFTIANFSKTTNDTLKFFVNHQFNGT